MEKEEEKKYRPIINKKQNYAEESLLKAIKRGDLNEVDELIYYNRIENKFSVDFKGNSFVYVALIAIKTKYDPEEQERRIKIVKKLLKEKYPHNQPNRNGNLPLHKAIKKNLIPIIKLLTENASYSQVNKNNHIGKFPLLLAIETNNLEVFEEVLNLEGIDFFQNISHFETVKDFLISRTKDTRQMISDVSREMLKLLETRLKKLNLEVEKIHTIKMNTEQCSRFIDKMRTENRKLFFSYSWVEESASTIPMMKFLMDFCRKCEIKYFLDRDEQNGVAVVGNGNLERFMVNSINQSNLTVAFINEHYLTSRNCLFEAYQFWDSEKKAFKENFYWIIHPEEASNVYGGIYRYKEYWEKRRNELNLKKEKEELLRCGKLIKESIFLNEIAKEIEGMINYLAENVQESYKNLVTEGFKEILKRACELDPPRNLANLSKNSKAKIELHEEKISILQGQVYSLELEILELKSRTQNLIELIEGSSLRF